MPSDRPPARCPQTGLAVPECSCRRCLEAMLQRFVPGLLDGEIRVSRTAGAAPPEDEPRRRAA